MARARGYHHGDLRRAATDAALALLHESGVDALTLRRVAERAGVSHPALYQHFPDKDALLEVVAEDAYLELRSRLRRALARAGPDPLDRLRAIGRAWVRWGLESPASFDAACARTRHPRQESATLLREPPAAQGVCTCAGCRDFLIVMEEVAKAQQTGAVRDDSPLDLAQRIVCLAIGYLQVQLGGRGVYRGTSLAGRLREFDGLLDGILGDLRTADRA